MNILKRTAGIIVSLIIAASVIAVPTSVFAAEEKGITLNRFGGYTYKIKKEAGYRYDIKVSDNGSKAIAAEIAYSETSDYVDIAALKKTGNTKPKVEVIKESNVTGEKTTIATFYNTQKYTNFSKDDYTISFKSTDTDVFTIDENGMINAVMTYDQLLKSGKCDKEGNYNVDFSFTIKFSDNSVYNGIFYLWVTK